MGSPTMTDFKRSPSKVWWANNTNNNNNAPEWREASAGSPGSQDSGFSDSEATPPHHRADEDTPHKAAPRVPKDIFKQLAADADGASPNLASNFREKTTPEKSSLAERMVSSEGRVCPRGGGSEVGALSEPRRRSTRYTKNNPTRVSRGLFKLEECAAHQYAESIADDNVDEEEEEEAPEDSLGATLADSYSWRSERDSTTSTESLSTRSLPAPRRGYTEAPPNRSAPVGTIFVGAISEGSPRCGLGSPTSSEGELEALLDGALDSPQHTSTPKGAEMRPRREKGPLRGRLRGIRHERPPPTPTAVDVLAEVEERSAGSLWLRDTRHAYEPECMTTLQGKSIAGELHHRVSLAAGALAAALRGILSHSRCIEAEYGSLNSGAFKHINPLIQSLTGNIAEFLATHAPHTASKIQRLCDDVRAAKNDDPLRQISALFQHWRDVRQTLLEREVKALVDRLECPASELDLRASVTAITSVSLRNEELIEIFTRADVVPILLILCEKCEGSSLKGLLLRALATVCSNSSAVRQFEKYSGVQIVADTLEEQSRPEPERSEAVALLAQVTAPWLEDNHSVKGLQDYSRKLVRSLTKFVASTKCCQNLLLCAAALANLSTMDPKAVKFMVHSHTTRVLLDAVKARGPRASIYLLEQVATLIANMSASEIARKQLTEVEAPVVLLHFLKINNTGEDVEKRLQQKSIIALSRLCGDKTAATQIVQLGGVEKLVKMCREKTQRFDSDAVLVAALATLRKIIDSCGSDVISALDAQELVEPKLLDSFLAYSTQNESYV